MTVSPPQAVAAFTAAITLAAGIPAAWAQESGLGVGAGARGVAQVESVDGGESRSRYYNVVEPWLEALLPYPALRFELRYAPRFYMPLKNAGDPGFGAQDPTVLHFGHAKLSSNPARGFEVSIADDLQAVPLQFGAPIDSSEGLVQTNDANATLRLERGRRFLVGLRGAARRFDTFEGLVGERDLDGDGALDPEEDLNGNGSLDGDLRPSFSEAGGAAVVGRRIGGTTRVDLALGGSARVFDDLPRNDYVATSASLELSRRAWSTLDFEASVTARRFQFERGDALDGFEAATGLSWRATRTMTFGMSGGARRTVDAYANQADLAEWAGVARRELARGASIDLESRFYRQRILSSPLDVTSDVDAGSARAELSYPIRWGVRLDTGYRFWRGGGTNLRWRSDHLFFLGLSWE